MKDNRHLEFFNNALEVLKNNDRELDSQGIYEYMKEIIDITLDPDEEREKIWKKIDGDTRYSTRYIRCLILKIKDKKYLIDVDEKELRPFDDKELEEKNPTFIPYKELSRGDFDYYDGT